MRMKKSISAICAAAVMLSSVIGGNTLFSARGLHAEEIVEDGSGEGVQLAAPQNFRYEEGNLVWDEVEGAYGYYLRLDYEDGSQRWFEYFLNVVEFDRMCFENYLELGEYTFELCAFDEDGTYSEWTEPLTVEFVPELDTPANVRLSEEDEATVEWDAVDGAMRYYVHIFSKDENNPTDITTYTTGTSYSLNWDNIDNGEYWFSIRVIDADYSVSEWTEPIKVIRNQKKLDAPANLRFDESGEKLLWDEVEGADCYNITFDNLSVTHHVNNSFGFTRSTYSEGTSLENWKSYVAPFADGEYDIWVTAYSNESYLDSARSEIMHVSYTAVRDESIKMPENVRAENGCIKADLVENANTYWTNILVNGEIINIQDRYDREAKYLEEEYSVYLYNNYPAGKYDVEIYVVTDNGNYNKKIYTLEFGEAPNDDVWVPDIYSKFDNILWDFDELRHPDTGWFWVRFRNAEDNSAALMAYEWGRGYYGFSSKLPDGKYLVDVCAFEYVDNKIGAWSKPIEITLHQGSSFDKENEISTEVQVPPEIEESVPSEDRVTTITVNPSTTLMGIDEYGEIYELNISDISIQASEIYDEEGLKRAEEALGESLDGNTHYNLLALTLLYNGEDFSNGYEGLVQVVIALPEGHLNESFSVYRIVTDENGNPVKEEIPGERIGDTYVIYLEHFSEYALVGVDPHDHVYGDEWENDEDGHWQICKECEEESKKQEHTFGNWTVTKEATEAEEGAKERACEVCGYKQTEALPKLTPAAPPETDKPDDVSDNTNNTDKTDKPEPETPDNDNPPTGITAVEASITVLAVCGAAMALTAKKRRIK